MSSRLDRLKGGVRRLAEEPMARVALRARILAPYRRHQFHTFERGAILDRPDWLYGTQHISIGEYVTIMKGGWLSAERETWEREEAALVFGRGAIIRPYCVFSASAGIEIGPYVGIGTSSSFIDSDHSVADDRHILTTPKEIAPIRVGAGSWLGERVTVLRGASIGRRCIIGAGAVVRGDIPDDSVAVGVPARVVRTVQRGRE